MTRPRKQSDNLTLPSIVFVGVFVVTAVLLGRLELTALGRNWLKPPRVYGSTEPAISSVQGLLAPPLDQHFSGCNAARAAGRVNIPSSDPSYRSFMDGDGDGLACEPWR